MLPCLPDASAHGAGASYPVVLEAVVDDVDHCDELLAWLSHKPQLLVIVNAGQSLPLRCLKL